jgi:hypothetical protein
VITLLLLITMTWYDKPIKGDDETPRSYAGAAAMGLGLPVAGHYAWNKLKPSNDEETQLKRTLLSHIAAGLITAAVQRGKSKHDGDPAYTNSLMVNGATIPLHAFYAMWKAHRAKIKRAREDARKYMAKNEVD